jgi:S1-C subfamily serine protease
MAHEQSWQRRPGYRLAYDHATGFGLVQRSRSSTRAHLTRGLAADVNVGDAAFVIGHGGAPHALKTQIVAKQEFAGSWEYLLDEAIYTAPAHPQWGGAALLDAQGNLIGIGSLLVQREVNGEAVHANMFVPIDLLIRSWTACCRPGAAHGAQSMARNVDAGKRSQTGGRAC